jgi:hypothetical protein
MQTRDKLNKKGLQWVLYRRLIILYRETSPLPKNENILRMKGASTRGNIVGRIPKMRA